MQNPGSKKDDGSRILHNEKLYNLHSFNIIRMIKSRRTKSVGHVALMEKIRNAHTILFRKPETKRSLKRHIGRWENNIKWILKKRCGRVRTGFMWLRIGTSGRIL
jgi:hypothetical protein